ncbi:EAL domain-containing protein [Asticcacaulis sp. EMRT-3]|uniref:putative bifunctional diguanylate cyclase/phosphodiesterase n=1 Tax=Asticcacaulis sp. EMRT-3 TaxID=3040349 RepID=UPI0024AF503D|nr:EAL domain-containing protein [Asticcacaulis sp. EMRT-3]MDI7776205.1 EAL domain-containing protein [Asticcacaulis sp. EMRT-3]
MVFKRLSTKLSVMYGGLFAIALLLIALACYVAVVSYARITVQNELQSAASVFKRIWTDRTDAQATNALLLSSDFGFKQALATHDTATVESAFDNLQARLKADTGLVIGPDGQPMAGSHDALAQKVADALQNSDAYTPQSGIFAVNNLPFQVVAAPVMAPDRLGWVVFASRLDQAEMDRLQALSSIPLTASILTQTRGGLWLGSSPQTHGYERNSLSFFIDQSLKSHEASIISGPSGAVIAVATPLPSLGIGAKSVLLLSYPLKAALSAYAPLLTGLLLIGILGFGFVVLASFYLARSLTRPILALKDAALALREGRSGHVEVVAHDEMSDLAVAFNDMAISIEDRERDITRLAKNDAATGLPNRSAFEDHLAALHEGGVPEHGGVAIVAIGVDRYTHIRAVWGVNYAHTLLARLQDILVGIFANAYIARLSGDTLGLCLSPCDAAQALPLARAIAARLDKRIKVTEDQSLDVAVSIGLYHISNSRQAPDESIERAMIALDQARAAKVKVASFDPRVYSELADTLLLTDQLYAALQNREMQVYYQPKFSYREGRITSAEALVRWNHTERGFVSPQRFVAIAEETGAIRDLTLQVLQTCLDDQRRLKDAGFDLDISINYSGRLLSDEAFNAQTLRLCSQAAGRICLEITETAVIEDPKIGLAAINTFVDSGLEISIDDFGTGLSSLAYLKQIPAHELKIDRSFIMEIESGKRDALLVRSSIDLAHGLGMKVTAEGVETAAAFTLLQAMGCDLAQGYGIARPMPYDGLVPFLNDFSGMAGTKADMPQFRPRRRKA